MASKYVVPFFGNLKVPYNLNHCKTTAQSLPQHTCSNTFLICAWGAARPEAVVILAGDLNAISTSPCLTALIELAALRDCFVECNTDTSGTVTDGFTFAASPNPYSFAREPRFEPLDIHLLPCQRAF